MTTIEKHFQTLDLAPGASLDQIKQAYRDLVQIWHPDRFAHSPRLRQKTEERLKEINASYEQLVSCSRDGGWREPPPRRPAAQPPPPDAEDGTGAVPRKAARPDASTKSRTKHRWFGLLSLIGGILLIGISFRDHGQCDVTRRTSQSSAPIPRAEPVWAGQEEVRLGDFSPASPESSIPCDPAAFAEAFVNALGSDDVGKPLAYYADTVAYFGKAHAGREFVRRDLEHDISRWSQRSYSIITGPDAWAEEDGWAVEFTIGYTVSNAQGTRNGTLAMKARLKNQGESFRITEIHAKALPAHSTETGVIGRKQSSASLWDRLHRLLMPRGRSIPHLARTR